MFSSVPLSPLPLLLIHLTFPDIAASHVKKPDKAVKLDVEALDLPVALTLGSTNDGQASAGQVGGAEGCVPAQSDSLAGNGVNMVNHDGEGRVGLLSLHEDLLGRKGWFAQGAEDEGVDAVGPVDKVGSAVLGAIFRLVVGDQPDIDVDKLLAFGFGQASLFLATEESWERGERDCRANESGKNKG